MFKGKVVIYKTDPVTGKVYQIEKEFSDPKEYEEFAQKNKVKNFSKITSSKVTLKRVFLKNTNFINCDFSQAQQIEIEDSDLTEVKFINVNWGEISEKRICKDLFEKDPLKAREVYRQLKYALDKQADYITANQFYALEMKAYERFLHKKLFGNLRYHGTFIEDLKFLLKILCIPKISSKEKYEFLIFKTHKLISEFGLSWTRPLKLLLIITLIVSFFSSLSSTMELLVSLDFLLITYIIWLILREIFIKFNEFRRIKWIRDLFTFSTIWIILSTLIILALKYNPLGALDHIAETLNIFKTFKGDLSNNNHFAGFKLLYTLYVIFATVLIYQMVVAIRRRVKR